MLGWYWWSMCFCVEDMAGKTFSQGLYVIEWQKASRVRSE